MQGTKLYNVIQFTCLCCNCLSKEIFISSEMARFIMLYVSISGEIGIDVSKQKVFCGTAASVFVQAADFAAVRLSSLIWRSSFGTNMW